VGRSRAAGRRRRRAQQGLLASRVEGAGRNRPAQLTKLLSGPGGVAPLPIPPEGREPVLHGGVVHDACADSVTGNLRSYSAIRRSRIAGSGHYGVPSVRPTDRGLRQRVGGARSIRPMRCRPALEGLGDRGGRNAAPLRAPASSPFRIGVSALEGPKRPSFRPAPLGVGGRTPPPRPHGSWVRGVRVWGGAERRPPIGCEVLAIRP